MSHAAAAVHADRLADRIEQHTDRLKLAQCRKFAGLASRTGLIWASRAYLANQLEVSRRTLNRVLADLDGVVFFVVGAEGRGGGTVLVPILRKGDDREATIRAVLRRAGEGWGEAAQVVGATVRCCIKLPGKALAILVSSLRKLGQHWLRESESKILTPESSLTPTAIGSGMAEPNSGPVNQPGPDEPEPGDNADSKGLQDGAGGSLVDRLAALAQRLGLRAPPPPPVSQASTEAHRRMHDPDALRESVRRLNALERDGPEGKSR